MRIPPQCGTAFHLKEGQYLQVFDPEGQQVSDLVAFNADDPQEHISSGRSIDYASKIFLTSGDKLYSNRSNVMLQILEDTVGRHDFTLAPCSAEMFRTLYGHDNPYKGCFGNLADELAPYNVSPDQIPTAFNIFMNVEIDSKTGSVSVEPPLSKAGDYIIFQAAMDLIIGLTACSAGQSNNFKFKPIDFEIFNKSN